MMRGRSGFTIMEVAVVTALAVMLTVTAIISYQVITKKNRDTSRMLDMNQFTKVLEEYRNETGVYPCGDSCAIVNSVTYSVDCSDTVDTITVDTINGAEPDEHNGFLNGGDCCIAQGGYPVPTTTSDDSTWGLYKTRALPVYDTHDPLEKTMGTLKYTYCYATPAQGRSSYALFARMEQVNMLPVNDSALCSTEYDLISAQYPRTGWTPDNCMASLACGNGAVDAGEQCDDGNTNNLDGCRNTCVLPYCGDSIIDTSRGESCDPPQNEEFLCSRQPPPPDYCDSYCHTQPLDCSAYCRPEPGQPCE